MGFLTGGALVTTTLAIVWIAFSWWALRNRFRDTAAFGSIIAIIFALCGVALILAEMAVQFWRIIYSATGI